MNQYLVQCWIAPKSGHELARRNRLLDLFRNMLANKYPNNEDMEKAVDRFDRHSEGLVLEPFVLESDTEVADCEKELMPEILKEHPEAKLLTWENIPNFA